MAFFKMTGIFKKKKAAEQKAKETKKEGAASKVKSDPGKADRKFNGVKYSYDKRTKVGFINLLATKTCINTATPEQFGEFKKFFLEHAHPEQKPTIERWLQEREMQFRKKL
ncbi:MAG: hypothetical protein V1911_01630 [Candidatus Micrarchaeota archaeon]